MDSPSGRVINMMPEVIVFSEEKKIASNVYSSLREQKCSVSLYTSEKEGLRRIFVKKSPDSSIDYFLVILDDFPSRETGKKTNFLKGMFEQLKGTQLKAIFVFPFHRRSSTNSFFNKWTEYILKQKETYSGVVFLGDLISERVPIQKEQGHLERTITNLLKGKKTSNPPEEIIFFPLSVKQAAEGITSVLFSMGAYRSSTALLGNPITYGEIKEIVRMTSGPSNIGGLTEDLQKPVTIGEIRYLEKDPKKLINQFISNTYTQEAVDSLFPEFIKVLTKRSLEMKGLFGKVIKLENLKGYWAKARAKLRKYSLPYKVRSSDTSLNFIEVKNDQFQGRGAMSQEMPKAQRADGFQGGYKKVLRYPFIKLTRVVFLGLLLVLFFPVALLGFSRASLSVSGFLLKNGFIQEAEQFTNLSVASTGLSKESILIFVKVPILVGLYEGSYLNSAYLLKIADLQKEYQSVFKKAVLFVQQLDSEGSSNNSEVLQDLYLGLETIYSKIGFLEGEWLKEGAGRGLLQKQMFPGKGTGEVKHKVWEVQKILNSSRQVFGGEKPKTYLLLFQDSSEIRPTGGKISSFGTVTFSNSKVINIQFFSLDEINKNLSRAVESPLPISKYFKKDFWVFEDSNWYLDFPTSAEKIEWFLDKGLDLPVDGVIALDSEAVKDMSLVVSKDPVVFESDTDPTVLKDFLQASLGQDDSKTLKLLIKLEALLNEKHILVFVHDDSVRKSLDSLGWSGSLTNQDCLAGCFFDQTGIIESAIGYGSENISKEMDLDISIEENIFKRKLIFYMENKNNFPYKSYLRLLTGADSGFAPVVVTSELEEYQAYPEVYGVSGHKEAGIYLEFEPYEAKAIEFSWEESVESFEPFDKYSLNIVKQPGVGEYPVDISVISHSLDIIKTEPAFSLTDDRIWVYNTNLRNDFKADFFW